MHACFGENTSDQSMKISVLCLLPLRAFYTMSRTAFLHLVQSRIVEQSPVMG